VTSRRAKYYTYREAVGSFSYPVFLDLTDVPVLLVGGGTIGSRKAAALLQAGARLTVVAPQISDDLATAATEVRRRPYRADDIIGHRLVLTATDDPAVNAAVHADATAAGVWVNSADDPTNCTFILPAVARDGDVVVAVSTGGSSPALASHLRRDAQQWLESLGAGNAARALSAQRDTLHAEGISTESIDWSDRVTAALGMNNPETDDNSSSPSPAAP
jgi:precorrin-2 dehydrogenase / sirohydrochlorin ferrochelatase